MKTVVEYLEEAIKVSSKDTFNDLVECIEVARQMERNQMIDLIKHVLNEVDFNELQIPYEILDLYITKIKNNEKLKN